ncbi:transporter, major facilitator superfamily [Fructobacillus pseudoficulneus]|uniref:Transporter, major facilitator superfamily n=1 Tax=Fructobacillus pseudoficulneus TaxID=220714 RepID=A0A3F3GY05_9LACO|nr:transporter, major facilitator superfamily [Fructobacillus pseudoficulneus]
MLGRESGFFCAILLKVRKIFLKKRVYLLAGLGIILIGADLRLPITILPPILPQLHSILGVPTSVSGWLTTIPILMFALVSPAIGKWGVRAGNPQVLFYSLLLLTVGVAIRVITNPILLFVGMILIGIGLSGGNVLLPSIIQEYFPKQSALLTGIYPAMMTLFSGIGTATVVPILKTTNFSTTMIIFATVTVLTLVVWGSAFRQLPQTDHELESEEEAKGDFSVKNYRVTWLITLFFGIQSLLAYSLMTWMPNYWVDHGFTSTTAGVLSTFFQVFGIPMAFLTPTIAKRKPGTVGMVIFIAITVSIATFGLLFPVHSFFLNALWSGLSGMGTAAAFTLSIVFFQRKTASFELTAELSGTAQSVGYLLAAIGPIASGYLINIFHSWDLIFGIYFILAVSLGFLGFAIIFSKRIGEEQNNS